MLTPEEQQLIQACLAGKAEGWDQFFDRYYASILQFLYRYDWGLSWEEARELTQEVFLSAIRNLPRFRGDCSLQTWLIRIAINRVRDYVEKRSAQKRGGGSVAISLDTGTDEEAQPLQIPSPEADPADQLIRSEEEQFLLEGLEALDSKCRELLRLRYFAGLSYEELAQTLRLHPKTVSSRLSRCLRRLRNTVQKLVERRKHGLDPSNSRGAA